MKKYNNVDDLKVADVYADTPCSYYGVMDTQKPIKPVSQLMLEDYIIRAVDRAAEHVKLNINETIETHRKYAQRMLHEVSNRVIDVEDMIKAGDKRVDDVIKKNDLNPVANSYKKRPKDAKKPLVSAEEGNDLAG